MRHWAVAVVLVLASSPVLADHIGIYNDSNGIMCGGQLQPAPSINYVFIIHEGSAAAKASKWRIAHEIPVISVSFNLTNPYLEIYPIGDPLGTGSTISYLDCRPSPYVIGSVGFLYFGGPVTGCDHLLIEAHQGDGFYPPETTPVFADCGDATQIATGGTFSFNPVGCDTCAPLPVQTSTWGAVKALYQ